MTSLLTFEDALDPSYNLVTGGVYGLIKVDDTVQQILIERTAQRRASVWHRGIVTGANVQPVVVLKEEGPLAGIDSRCYRCRLDDVVSVSCGLSFFLAALICHGVKQISA